MNKINKVRSRLTAAVLTTAIVSLATATSASAAGFALGEQSTAGIGMANAGVAAGGTLSDQFWNPATLGDVHGFQSESDLTLIVPIVNVTSNPVGPYPTQSQGNVGNTALVPASNFAYRVDNHIILGLGVNSPFGLSTGYNGSSYLFSNALAAGGAGIAGTSRIFTIDVNPNIAYQFNDQFTIAIGLQGQYMEAQETAFIKTNGVLSGHTNNIGFGFTLGADWKPMKGTTIGLGYRSGITNTLAGTINGVTPGVTYTGNMTLKTPGIATLGVAQEVTPLWTLRAGLQYTNWSVLGNAPVSGTAGALLTASVGGAYLPFNYKDAWMVNTGAEYKWDPATTLRAGIAYETSPITSSNRTFRLPDSDRMWLSTGLSYALNKTVSIDAGYTFVHAFGSTILAGPTGGGTGPVINGPFSGSFNGNVHIFSTALKMKFD